MNYSFELTHHNHEIIQIICKANKTDYNFIISSIESEWWNEYKKYFNNEDFYEIWKFLNYVFNIKDDNIKILIAHDYLDSLNVIVIYKNETGQMSFPMEFRKTHF